MQKPILCFGFVMLMYNAFAQNSSSDIRKLRYRIFINTMDERVVKGLLIKLEDSSAIVSLGKWNEQEINNSIDINYSQIQQVKLKKKNGLLKGILIGGGIGLAPVVFGEGGAYVSLIAFPLGLVTGGIIGANSGKKYYIQGDLSSFNDFKKRIR